ncbi:hypothetical protein [Arenibacter troitsensis]|uniref:Uncharacterized protein n=1 Tax=Arenibacter troitsensis TaxID=188872 RepID=A0A1X7J889_9FLAO|nr:hypothetical protein [Arenibacter troitsensis]SMG23527.1 hypothetical protein SAMN03080602_01454 [Arenibacter troitsensis]
MEDFILWSGWFFGLVSVIIAVFQYLGKEKLKKQINTINNTSTTLTSGDGGVTVGNNSGGINVGK